MAISRNVFIHDADRAALTALKAIPGFTQVLKLFMKIWNEENMHIRNMATKVRLSEEQLPEYYNMLPPICDKLGIDIPELYLELDPIANAYTTGDTKAAITITSGLLETIPEELLPTVLAHECGHIACHHVLYTTMGMLILNGALSSMSANVANIAITPISAAFAYWMRCSEYSADRAAILCDGTPNKTFEICMRLAGMDKDILHKANIDAFFNQAKEYKELVGNNAFNKFRELYQFYQVDHPVHAVRAWEAKEWANSENFIKSKAFFDSYEAGSAPAELPISWNEKHFTGRDYSEVEQELIAFGFDNVDMVRNTDKSRFTKEGSVTAVTIAGSNKFKDAEWYPSDTSVVVTYYLPLSEEEIASMHPGEVKMPNAAKYYVGKKFGVVVQELTELGFVNVVVEEIKDIKKANDKGIGSVSMLTIDKNPTFSKGDWKSDASEVKVFYHSLIE